MNIEKRTRRALDVTWENKQSKNNNLSEHERIQLIQRHALNKNVEEFVELLNTFPVDKQADLIDMMEYVKEDKQVC